ncbi:hypothetical protein ABB02_01566 [Clostridiaceae bacterium JG1575]|nr:hypothetical protein ABB02_01566 [Clostridiaceae bacterium JG1575]
MEPIITSPANVRLKQLRRLKERKGRKESGQFLLEGRRLIQEALRQGASIEAIYWSSDPQRRSLEALGMPLPQMIEVRKELLDPLCATVNPQGILAQVHQPPGLTLKEAIERPGLYLYLEEVQDPGNLGTIIRSAHAFGAAGILLSPKTADPFQEKVLRATMGSIFRVPLALGVTSQDLASLIDSGFSLYLSDLANAQAPSAQAPAPASILCIGNEGKGVSDALRSLPHQSLRIPMPGGAESLNAGIAASLFLYEWLGRVPSL